jgi:AraC-like DNA-binding protein
MVNHDKTEGGGVPVVRFVRPSHSPGLELAHYPDLTRGWRSVPEAYQCFTMVDRLEGEAEVISRGVRAPFEAGSLTAGQPGEPWVLRPRSRMRGEVRVIRVYDDDLPDEMREELGARRGGSPFPRGPQNYPPLARSFARLYGAIRGGETLEMQERLLAFLAAMVELGPRSAMPAAAAETRGVRRAQELLHARFDGEVSLDELALAAGTNKFTLLRGFAREHGMTPHAYQVQLRMARACRLLARGVPLADVALAVGYSQQSALHRSFKRLVGLTPGDYVRGIG